MRSNSLSTILPLLCRSVSRSLRELSSASLLRSPSLHPPLFSLLPHPARPPARPHRPIPSLPAGLISAAPLLQARPVTAVPPTPTRPSPSLAIRSDPPHSPSNCRRLPLLPIGGDAKFIIYGKCRRNSLHARHLHPLCDPFFYLTRCFPVRACSWRSTVAHRCSWLRSWVGASRRACLDARP